MAHECFGCREGAGRFSFDGGTRLRVPERFRGPPGNVNGGFATGMLACSAISNASESEVLAVERIVARLRAGVPVDRKLKATVEPGAGQWAASLFDGESELLSAQIELKRFAARPKAGDVIGDVPEERAVDIAELVATQVPDAPPFFEETGDHPIAGCFSCGPEHPHGLHVYPRVVSDGVTCAPWTPDVEFSDGEGTLSVAVLTAAIDCSSGICMPVSMQRDLLDRDEFFLLGTMDVRYLRVAPVAMEYRVAAKALRRDGRKFFGLSALVGGDNVAYAMAESTWIIAAISRTTAFGAAPAKQ